MPRKVSIARDHSCTGVVRVLYDCNSRTAVAVVDTACSLLFQQFECSSCHRTLAFCVQAVTRLAIKTGFVVDIKSFSIYVSLCKFNVVHHIFSLHIYYNLLTSNPQLSF